MSVFSAAILASLVSESAQAKEFNKFETEGENFKCMKKVVFQLQ